MGYILPTTGTDPKTTTKQALEALIDSAIATASVTGLNGFIYATDPTDGLARTSDGDGFFTASDLQLIFWLNDGGAATQLSEIGTPLTQSQVEELQANYATITAAAAQVAEDAAQISLDRVASADNAARAEAAQDAVTLMAAVKGAYVDATIAGAIADGVAALVVDDTFAASALDVDYIGIYLIVTGPEAQEIGRLPTTAALDAAMASALRDADTLEAGLALTKFGQRFTVVSDTGMKIYENDGSLNLYDPSTDVADRYLSATGSSEYGLGWAHTGPISVAGRANITLTTNTTRRAGLAFYDASGDYVSGSYTASTASPLTVAVPASAATVKFNVQSDTIAAPTEIMLASGTAAVPYRPYGETGSVEVQELVAKSEFDQIVTYQTSPNLADPDTVVYDAYLNNAGDPVFGVDWAYNRIAVTPGNQYTISTNTERRVGVSFCTAAAPNEGIDGSYVSDTANPLTVTAPAGAATMIFNVQSNTIPMPTEVMVNEGAVALDYQPFGVRPWLDRDAFDPPLSAADNDDVSTATLYLAGEGSGSSYVESNCSGDAIKNYFTAFPEYQINALPAVFNLGNTDLNGVTQRSSVGDDIAPDHIFDATIGANHGYRIDALTATGHGKALADRGSIWAKGGVEYVLIATATENSLIMTRRVGNGASEAGTYTHVSGATNTADIVATANVAQQWYPPHKNKTIETFVDGKKLDIKSGTFKYRQGVQFVETVDILPKSEMVAWWEASGSSGDIEPDGTASLRVSNTYRFDINGQLTITRNWVDLNGTPINDLMGLQSARAATTTHYYIPDTVEFVHDGDTVNYSMIEAADRTSTGGQVSVNFDASNTEANGPFVERVLSLSDDYVFAQGFLPLGDVADDAARRALCSDKALEIRGNTDKLYFRVVDKGDFTATPGEAYSTVAYKVMVPRSADRFAYPVLTNGPDFFFIDWHLKDKIDSVPVPPEFIGRQFEVIRSRNATVLTDVLTGQLPVKVEAATDYGYVILKVT